MTEAVRHLACGGGGGGCRALLGDRVTSPLHDDDEDDDDDDNALLGVLSRVQHAYRHLLQSNWHSLYTGHGTIARSRIYHPFILFKSGNMARTKQTRTNKTYKHIVRPKKFCVSGSSLAKI